MSDSKPTATHHCCVCGKPSFLRCSRCLGAQYCDVSCQRKDWKSHKESCKDAEEFKYEVINRIDGPQTTVEDVDEQIVVYRRLAELGDRESIFDLGVAYRTGMGVAQDEVEAVKLFKRAAALGHSRAQYNLGVAYDTGSGGVDQDKAEAVKWYRKAAEAGHVDSLYNLGLALRFGHGVKIDYTESFK